MMRILGNVLWHFPFLGFLFALSYAICGLIFCITIIGIPVGLGFFQFSIFLLAPFSRSMVDRKDLSLLNGQQGGEMSTFAFVSRVFYFPFGLLGCINVVSLIVAECITLIGIPCGIVWARSLAAVFNPVNKVCVPREVGDEIARRKAANTLGKYVAPASAPPMVDEFVGKAQQKTDDELKAILESRDDYNPRLVRAAEQVLLSRTTGIEIPPPLVPPIPSGYAYGTGNSCGKISGELMIMIGGLLPLTGFILTIIRNVILALSKGGSYKVYPIISSIKNCIDVLLLLAAIGLLIAGFLQVRDKYSSTARIGIILLPVAVFLAFIATIFGVYGQYLSFNQAGADVYGFYFGVSSILYYVYVLLFCVGILIWMLSSKDKGLNISGGYILCGAFVLSGVSRFLFISYLSPYLLENDLTQYFSWIFPLRDFVVFVLSIVGWYLFVGSKLKNQKI